MKVDDKNKAHRFLLDELTLVSVTSADDIDEANIEKLNRPVTNHININERDVNTIYQSKEALDFAYEVAEEITRKMKETGRSNHLKEHQENE